MLSQKEQSIRENHDKLRQVFKDRGVKSNTDIKGNLQEINKRVVLAQSNLNQIKAQIFQDQEEADQLITTMLSQVGSDTNVHRVAQHLS